MGEDRGSHTERDAGLWEAMRRQSEHVADRPTRAELDRDEAAEREPIDEWDAHEMDEARDRMDAIRERLTAEVRGIRFRVEVACDGYAALTESDVPDEYGGYRAYIGGAADAARAIREAPNGGTP